MSSQATDPDGVPPETIDIRDLLQRLQPSGVDENAAVSAFEIAAALSRIFNNTLAPDQTRELLTALHKTGEDRKADVIALCAAAMRDAAVPIEAEPLQHAIESRGKILSVGSYNGGLVGDFHLNYHMFASR
jgi:anthranilate phosphoribosyltransferase